MNPKPQRTRPGDRSAARARRQIAEKYLEVADVIASEDGAAINVCVGCAILAGIAAPIAVTFWSTRDGGVRSKDHYAQVPDAPKADESAEVAQ